MLSLLLATTARAQDETPLSSAADLHREPEGTPLVSLTPGAPVETGKAKGDWREVTVEGWIFSPSIAPSRRDGFDLVVTSGNGENLRRSPNGPVVGRAREGTLLEKVGVKGKWTRVRRNGWVPRASVRPKAPARAQTPAPPQPSAVPAATPRPNATRAAAEAERAQTARATALNATPEGGPYGSLEGGAPARILGRSGGWARVQIEGWVREADLQAADDGVLRGVTTEEVRATPDRFVGRTLEWKLQLIAVQNADELRAEIPPGQPYLLTRGPLPEPGFVYVMIPTAWAAEFRALPALEELTLRVTIRAPHTRYLTTPVAELVDVVK